MSYPISKRAMHLKAGSCNQLWFFGFWNAGGDQQWLSTYAHSCNLSRGRSSLPSPGFS